MTNLLFDSGLFLFTLHISELKQTSNLIFFRIIMLKIIIITETGRQPFLTLHKGSRKSYQLSEGANGKLFLQIVEKIILKHSEYKPKAISNIYNKLIPLSISHEYVSPYRCISKIVFFKLSLA
jgi:hypothetical protein